ncbi:MAG: electron transfer flavoprotein subunit beta/FixA family protein [Clostridium sp.]|uniref:electron transfer flavoprotein subunit beta/FixA family protein n=1 Tax=Clostridia TaxID=186801 RepID=UPI00067EBF5D|nr:MULTISPECIES: electron transfer flavoprotein subunit beta/FixA family protein [Clostridia]MBS6763561.1 electron transfer flavoprotein subunit beta/FixA family protein [Clostridium sp.]
MNILVCVKQVPDTTEIKIDPVRNTLIRAGVPSILNPFDAYAMEAAARLKDADPKGTKIIVMSMGPEAAKAVLRECLSMGADAAYLMSDRAFGGSDTLATSYILSQGLKEVQKREGNIDLIFCGKQAIDGDTAQVGPELAEHLGYPQITYGLEAKREGACIRIKKEVEEGFQIIEADLPAVVTFTKASWEPRLATIKSLLASRKAEIHVITHADTTDIEDAMIGLKGSPTKVKKTFVPQKKVGGIKITGKNAVQAGKELAALLDEAKVV